MHALMAVMILPVDLLFVVYYPITFIIVRSLKASRQSMSKVAVDRSFTNLTAYVSFYSLILVILAGQGNYPLQIPNTIDPFLKVGASISISDILIDFLMQGRIRRMF